MKKLITMMVFFSSMSLTTAAFAGYGTAFSRAEATWIATDGSSDEVDVVYTSADSSSSCGTNCRRYDIWSLFVENHDKRGEVWKLGETYGRVFKNGTDGTSPYYSHDWDMRSGSLGSWVSPTYSSNYISDSGRRYYARKIHSTDLDPDFAEEVRFDYEYTAGFSGQRRFNFYYIGWD